ncbi:MAG: adenylate/guanylate cyclase domain-containing protein, partial [Pseudomonadota bacterium]
ADRLLAEGTESELLGGKDQIATVVFTDMRGFSTITEQLGAQGTVQLLNQYFERMVGCISDHGGLLDKFIGDAIMAGFGIPVPRGDDEDNALRASISMIEKLWEWNVERTASGLLTLDMGVGISTDQVVSGNIGSAKRMDYTMIGDGVNLAARLESACKQYNARILLSGHTQERLRGVYRLREIDRVIVKGKTVPVPVWECLDYHSDESFPNMSEALGSFNDGMKAYRAAQWDKAQSAFMAALDANPNDKLADLYVWRCQHLELNPPGDDWDGVWVMTEK